MPTKVELTAKIEALEEFFDAERYQSRPGVFSVGQREIEITIAEYRAQLAALSMEPEIPENVKTILRKVEHESTKRTMDAMYGPVKPDPRDEALRAALDALFRATHLSEATIRFVRNNNLEHYTEHWDDALCDGGCLCEDQQYSIDDMRVALAKIKEVLHG